MEQRVTAITLDFADLKRSRAFYEKLGWKQGNKSDDVIFFQLNGSVLALWGRGQLADDARVPGKGSGFGGIVLSYNGRSKEDVDAVLAEAKAAGGKILKPAADTFWGGYGGNFADPDGHIWEVAWNPFWPIDAEGRVSLS